MLAILFHLTLTLPSLGEGCPILWQNWPDESQVHAFVNCVSFLDQDECPVADAGLEQFALVGEQVFLDASGSTIPKPSESATYSWSQLETGAPIVTLTGQDTVSPGFVPTSAGFYSFQLVMTWFCLMHTAITTVVVDESPAPGELDLEPIAQGLSSPVQVTFSSAKDSRLFVVCKNGLIKLYKNGSLLTTPFLDLSPSGLNLVSFGFEQGLLGLAFDPDYPNNGVFYVNYTGRRPDGSGSSRDTRIVAFKVDPQNADVADPSQNALLLSIDQPESNHNGGQLLFGPDGYLYVGTGDGGGANDNHGTIGNSQDPSSLLGKMLRLQANGLSPLTVPQSNPFLGDPKTRDEIWALGLRNPWRFSFDRLNGNLFIADVGQNLWEEISFQPASSTGGENYGWRLKEGTHCFNPKTNCDPNNNLVDPVHEYGHSSGRCSVTGGFVYRGSSIPALQGRYLFADWCTGEYWTLSQLGETWASAPLTLKLNGTAMTLNVLGFGEGHDGELYVCVANSSGSNGQVLKIVNPGTKN